MPDLHAHRAAWVVPVEGVPVREGVLITAGPLIAWVGPWDQRPAQYHQLAPEQITDHGYTAILPGFVNPHSHVVFHHQRGLRDGAPFMEWMTEGVIRQDWSDHAANAAACEAGFREGLAAGITTWGDNHFLLAPLAAAATVGVRALCFLELFGVLGGIPKEQASLDRRLDEAQALLTDRLRIGISPHAIYTVPPPLLDHCARRSAEEGYLLSMHLAETADERTFLTTPSGALRDWIGPKSLDTIPPFAGSFTDYLRQHRLLTDRLLVIHGVHLTPAELRDLAGAGAHLVHCPMSNARLRCGIAPVEETLRAGMNLALGTDSIASGERHDPWATMRLALLLHEASEPQRGLTDAARILEAATLGGARALHWEDEVGSLKAGKRADFVVCGLPEVPSHAARGIEAELVYSGERTRVRSVWMDATQVV